MVFVESRAFSRRLHELAGGRADDVLRTIQEALLDSPERGRVVPGLGGIRKARCANIGRGKGERGGFRYFYLLLERRNHIHLLFLFDKDEQEDLTSAERAALRRLVAEIKQEGGNEPWRSEK